MDKMYFIVDQFTKMKEVKPIHKPVDYGTQ